MVINYVPEIGIPGLKTISVELRANPITIALVVALGVGGDDTIPPVASRK